MSDAQDEVLGLLLREHRDVEQHLAAARRWIPELLAEGVPAMERLASELESFSRVVEHDLTLHIAHEDHALFRVLARHIGDQAGPVAVMLMEHRHLERQARQYQQGLKAKNPSQVADAATSIVQVLSAHLGKEENILFPLSQRTLSPEEWEEVLRLTYAAERVGE